jgi:hypothetical protein
MIATVRGHGTGIFTTEDSLYIAEALLKAREAADTGLTIRLAAANRPPLSAL